MKGVIKGASWGQRVTTAGVSCFCFWLLDLIRVLFLGVNRKLFIFLYLPFHLRLLSGSLRLLWIRWLILLRFGVSSIDSPVSPGTGTWTMAGVS